MRMQFLISRVMRVKKEHGITPISINWAMLISNKKNTTKPLDSSIRSLETKMR